MRTYLDGMGFKTLRGEVRFWQAMFGLCFWEEIFTDTGQPDTLNDIPLDLFSGTPFYQARRAAIDGKAAAVANSDLRRFVGEQLRRHGLTWTRIVFDGPRGDFSYRQVLDSPNVSEFLSVIQPGVFAKIVHRIAMNPNENRAGLPDYVAWREQVLFIEVKGIRERIRDTQAVWLSWMHAGGIPVKVLRIKGVSKTPGGSPC